MLYPAASSLWCLALAVIFEKCYEFSISLEAAVYKFVSLLNIKLWKVGKT